MKRYVPWLGAAAIIVIVFGSIYATVQQSQRGEADWPQLQLAEDAAAALDTGTAPASVATGSVSLNESLAPFVVIYDAAGKPVSGSGKLDSRLPQAPLGILTAAKGRHYHAVTWQPQPGVRIAAVTVAADKYYVLSGRSLSEVEKHESQTLALSALGCAGSLIILAILYITSPRAVRRK